MKIDKVILTCNYNSLYTGFWNPLSRLYKVKFGIDPVLVFLGTEEELQNSKLNEDYGQIIRHDNVKSPNVNWTTTWALFYFTQKFPEDVFLIMGIDQIPMGTKFIENYISEFGNDDYVMVINDAYEHNGFSKCWSKGGISPSSYHIAKGKTFKEIYKFEETFQSEISKIESLHGSNWGVDEIYSSKILFESKNPKIKNLSKFGDLMRGGRLECYRTEHTIYDLDKIKRNEYIECHACRPYQDHKQYLDKLISDIETHLIK